MALRKPKPKKKKNPYRLSSDRQPGIAKANERRTPGSRKFGPMTPKPPKRMIPLGPKKGIPPGMEPYRPTPVPGMEPYRPTPPGIKRFLDKLEKKKKKGLEPTPAQRERLKNLKKELLRKKQK